MACFYSCYGISFFSSFLNPSSMDFRNWITISCGAILYIVRCLTAPLTSLSRCQHHFSSFDIKEMFSDIYSCPLASKVMLKTIALHLYHHCISTNTITLTMSFHMPGIQPIAVHRKCISFHPQNMVMRSMHTLLKRKPKPKRYRHGIKIAKGPHLETGRCRIQTYICVIQTLVSELFAPTMYFNFTS